MPHPLPLTGERTLPGASGEEYWFARHEVAYRWVVETFGARLRGGVVVEAGSGEGYGAAMLRDAGARAVVALEFDEPAVAHASSAYDDVTTVRANLAALPIATGSADVLVCLQVVEHLWDLRAFLSDCCRALRAGGTAVVTTPNRPVFSPGLPRGAKPTNPFHVEEFDAEQVAELLATAGFVDVRLLGVHHGHRIAEWEREHGETLVGAQVRAALHTLAATDTLEGASTTPGAEPSGSDGLAAFVASVTASDFVVGAADGAQDLLAVAVRP